MTLGPTLSTAPGAVLQTIGTLIDLSHVLGLAEGTDRALEWADQLEKRSLSGQHAALLEYFRANAWGSRRTLRHRSAESAWDWVQPEMQREILHLRRAAQHAGFKKLSALRRCQILTNLGNSLSVLGRSVDAVAIWSHALSINPQFGMALGNRGYGLMRYANSLYDKKYRSIVLYFAHKDLTAALSPRAKYEGKSHPEAIQIFTDKKAEIEEIIDIDRATKAVKMDGFSMGSSQQERHYREWVLFNRLFLNPLNELGYHSVAASDPLSLPSYTTEIGEPPTLIGFFNQMKQEYASARWLFYDGVEADRVHFSDRRVTLFNTLDYPAYSVRVEKVKAAYRIVYSLLDKIAFFLNDYAQLRVKPRDVYFKTIWYERGDAKKAIIRREFQSKNLPLRGLYWLSKDLFDPEFQDVMEPEAQELYIIRNHLEHSYLKVHEILPPRAHRETFDKAWIDRLAYSISRSAFEDKTFKVFRLARAALIYLALGMRREEVLRGSGRSDAKLMPMTLPLLEDK